MPSPSPSAPTLCLWMVALGACSNKTPPGPTGDTAVALDTTVSGDSGGDRLTDGPSSDVPFPATDPVMDVVQALTAYLEPNAAVQVDERMVEAPFDLPPADATRWSATYFRHQEYACARSGQQSFLLLNPPGADWSEPLDLFVYLHGGGIGAFTPDGTYQPEWFLSEECISMVDEEDADRLFSRWSGADVCSSAWPPDSGLARAVVEAADQRVLIASKCDHDTYGGEGTPDTHNPWNPDNHVDGLLATMAAVQTVFEIGATDDAHALTMAGASAGGVGVLTVSRALSQRGTRVDGVISDGAVMTDRFDDVFGGAPSDCAFREQVADPIHWRPRLGRVADSDRQPHRLWTADDPPVFLSYSPGDSTFCGAAEEVFADMADTVRRENPGGVSEVRATCLDDEHGCNAHALIRWASPSARNTLACNGAECEPVVQTMVDWLDARRARR